MKAFRIFNYQTPGYRTSSLALRENHILRVPEDRVLDRIFRPNREKERGQGILHEELSDFYTSPNIIIYLLFSVLL
jgi:hypothetical protein